ncbi:Archaeal primase DnaG/twinkle, TOPRIM domain, partial [uncultured Caudovirales phage]
MLATELSALLAQRCEEIVRDLLPNGEKKSGEWCVGSIQGEKGESLKVHLKGAKAGVWADFATGERGDMLDLWAKIKGQSTVEAMKEVADYFNFSTSGYKATRPSKKTFTKPPKTPVEPLKTMSPVHIYLSNTRKLSETVIQRFKIPHSESEIVFNYIRDKEIIFVKRMKLERKDGKKQIVVSPNAEPCLFGWQVIPPHARTVVICEGELDAMSFCQYGIPALSVPFGGGRGEKQRWLEYEIENLNRFDEIFICMDNDDAGQEAAKEIVNRLDAHRCRLVELPMKDANECLMNGLSKEDIQFFIDDAKSLDPEELRPHSDFTMEAYEIIHPVPGKFLGYNLGWEKCEDHFLFKPSGLTMWTGYNGHGKTLFLGQVMLNMIRQGARVCVASMELYPAELMARTYLQTTAQQSPSLEFIKAVDTWLERNLFIFNLVGTGKIERLLEVFLYARRRYGVDVFIVDSLTTLNIAEDDYNGQKELTEKLRDFKLQYNCHIHLVTHPRKPRDESEIPGKYDIRGGGAISDLADNCFAVWRNKAKEEIVRRQARGDYLTPDEYEVLKEHDSFLKCDKNRHGRGKFKEGVVGFWFHEPSGQYLERESLL